MHHLWFQDQSYSTLKFLIKCKSAIKKVSDRDAIRQVKDGRISILATDHASYWEENRKLISMPHPTPLIQHSLLLMLEMCEQNCFSPELIVERACHAPARLFQVEDRGYLREGYWADIVVVNLPKILRLKILNFTANVDGAFFPFNFHKLDRDHYRFRTDCLQLRRN